MVYSLLIREGALYVIIGMTVMQLGSMQTVVKDVKSYHGYQQNTIYNQM